MVDWTRLDSVLGKHSWITPDEFRKLYQCDFDCNRPPHFPDSHREWVRYREEMRTAFERAGFFFDCTLAPEPGFKSLVIRNPVTGRTFSWSFHTQNCYGAMMQMHHQWQRLMHVGADKW